MNAAWMLVLSVMFLLEPEERVDVARAREISEDADRVEVKGAPAKDGKDGDRLRITAQSSDFDRVEGVSLFEGDVVLSYSDNCVLCADRLWAFLVGSNQLDRVVVSGHVSVTNETRVGTCALAIFRRKKSEIEMFGDDKEGPARLVENGDDASALAGRRIRFWFDTEQVEVDNARITTQSGQGRKTFE